MKVKIRYIVLFILMSSLVACVSVTDGVRLISDAEAKVTTAPTINRDLDVSRIQSCEITPVMNENISDTQGLDPEKISFLNWNIYKGNGDRWQHDLSTFAQSHDVMTIQEVLLDDELAGLLESHDFNWVMNTAFHLDGVAAGVMTVASSDAVHSCGFKDKEPLIRVPKSTLISYYAINGSEQRLLVANIHSINFTLGIDSYRKQLEKLHDAIEHHEGPMIVAGDFNSWNDDRVKEVAELIDKLSLSEIEYAINNKTHVFGNAIDHIFYRQLELVSNQVWQVASSDHNPISVDFRFHTASY